MLIRSSIAWELFPSRLTDSFNRRSRLPRPRPRPRTRALLRNPPTTLPRSLPSPRRPRRKRRKKKRRRRRRMKRRLLTPRRCSRKVRAFLLFS
jgi:hypothetical protein